MAEPEATNTEQQSHEPGQRKGDIRTCDAAECDSTDFNVVLDDLTKQDLVVCEDCGFTMGWY